MSWRKARARLHIRTLSGHEFTVRESPSVQPKVLMANMAEAICTGEAADLLVGQIGIVWIRASQIEALWIAE